MRVLCSNYCRHWRVYLLMMLGELPLWLIFINSHVILRSESSVEALTSARISAAAGDMTPHDRYK